MTPSPDADAPTAARRPRRGHGAVLLLLVLLVAALGYSSRGVTDPAGTNAPKDAFSADRAAAVSAPLLEDPRPVGSPANDRAQDRMARQLTDLGFRTRTQESIGAHSVDGDGSAAYTDNLIATRSGTDPSGTIVLATHIDSVPGAPGAADAGVGLSVILESVRALGPDALRNDLVVLVVDGEENGLLGAQAFLEDGAEDLAEPVVVLNHEARGTSGRPMVTRTSGPVHDVLGSMPHPEYESFTDALFGIIPNDTDFTFYRAAGWWGMDMAITDDAWAYHSPQDDTEHLDRGTLQHYGDMTLALTRDLGDRDLGALPDPREEPVQTTAPWGILSLPAPVVTGLGVVAPLAILAMILVLRRRHDLTLRGAAGGALTTLIALPLSVAAALLLWQGAATLSPQMLSQVTGEPVRAGLFLLADLLATAAVAGAAAMLARRVLSRAALLSGAALATTLLLAALAMYSPQLGSSMIPPAAFAAVGALLAVLLPPTPGLLVRLLALVPTGWMLGAQLSALAEFGIASSAGGLGGTALVGMSAAAGLFLAPSAPRPSRRRSLLVPIIPALLAVIAVGAGTLWTLQSPEPIQERAIAHVDASTGSTRWEASHGTPWGRTLDGTDGTTPVDPAKVEVRELRAGDPQRVRIVLTAARDATRFEIAPESGTLQDVGIDGNHGEPGSALGSLPEVDSLQDLGSLQIDGIDAGQRVVIQVSVPEGTRLHLAEIGFDPSAADGWTAPPEEVSVTVARLRIEQTVTV